MLKELKEFIKFIQTYREFGSYWICFLALLVFVGVLLKLYSIFHPPSLG